MANLAVDLEALAAELGETVESAVLGTHYNKQWDEKDTAPRGSPMTWVDARPWLDEEYNDSYGGADCRPFVAWSQSWVFWVHEYDGATWLAKAPRNPAACTADFSGT